MDNVKLSDLIAEVKNGLPYLQTVLHILTFLNSIITRFVREYVESLHMSSEVCPYDVEETNCFTIDGEVLNYTRGPDVGA